MALTLYEKIFNRHVVREDNDTYLIYIDRHLVHEVTSPQAFEGLRMADRKIWRTNSTFNKLVVIIKIKRNTNFFIRFSFVFNVYKW